MSVTLGDKEVRDGQRWSRVQEEPHTQYYGFQSRVRSPVSQQVVLFLKHNFGKDKDFSNSKILP